MTIIQSRSHPATPEAQEEDVALTCSATHSTNPVIETCLYAFKATGLVSLNETGIKDAARYIYDRLCAEDYTPRTWRTHSLHLLPPEPYAPDDPLTKGCLDWIFVVSSLNFSFWSEREGTPERYGVEWRTGWGSDERMVHTGYWSLVAALDRALEEGLPITDPKFYSSEECCPDSLLDHVFRPAPQSKEPIPLLRERIAILREVGRILCTHFEGSFQGFLAQFLCRYDGRGTAFQLVEMIIEYFPPFRDQTWYEGRQVFLWKRAQILVAETWAAFTPSSPRTSHAFFPHGAAIEVLTMFADYRVPQILHHLQVLTYPPALMKTLQSHAALASGSREEISIRSASIVAVDRLRQYILQLQREDHDGDRHFNVSSVIIDFYLWDLAKWLEGKKRRVEGIRTCDILPAHRTRSIWY